MKKVYLSLCSLVLLSFTNSTNIYNSYSSIKGNNFSFQYSVETTNTEENYPIQKVSNASYINYISKVEISYSNSKIDYKNILCNQIFKNNELKKYKKEILYFVENLYFVNSYELGFTGSGYTNKIGFDVDGENYKFGFYLVTINASIIKFQNMDVNFKIDDKEYNFELKYYLVDNFLANLNYFENVKELDNFINKYGL